MPRRRIPTFEARLEALCEEAGVPRFDRTDYELLSDVLYFLWDDPDPDAAKPKFVIGVPLASASINGMGADDLRGTWDRKFGPQATAEAA